MVRTSTEHDDQTGNEQSQNRYNFYGCKYELSFSIDRNGEDIQKDDDNDDKGDPYGRAVPSEGLASVALKLRLILTSLPGPRS
jgi:hypothetical protein